MEDRIALAREDACRILAACYYQPEVAFVEEGIFATLEQAVSQIQPEWTSFARKMGEAFSGSPLEDLLLDYTRLFLGPSHILAKPYGSVWLEGEKTLMGDTTVAVLELYREGGFDLDEQFLELPDHIAVEMEFLYLLIFRENEARFSGDRTDGDRLNFVIDLKKRFLSQHLGRWIAPFSAAMQENATTAFYRHLAMLTELLVGYELIRTVPESPAPVG